MSWDHERVQELLAALVLDGLDADERGLAERAIVEHLPSCGSCRIAFEELRGVAGDLALAAPAAAPPDTLRARLQRAVRPTSRLGRWGGWVAASVAIAIIGALSGWNLMLTDRLGDAETRQRWLVDAVGALGSPDAGVVPLQGSGHEHIQLLISPGSPGMYVVGSGMRNPEEGVYHVWLVRANHVWSAGTFVPKQGVAMLRVEEDPATLEQVMVTQEATEDAPSPTASPVAQVVLVSPSPTATPTVTATATPSPSG
jgi:hypothetical protein